MAISHLMVLFYSRNRHNVTLFLTITPLYLTVTLFLIFSFISQLHSDF